MNEFQDPFNEMVMKRLLQQQQVQQQQPNLPSAPGAWALLNPALAGMMGFQPNHMLGNGTIGPQGQQQQLQQQIQQQMAQQLQQRNMLFNNALAPMPPQMQPLRAQAPMAMQSPNSGFVTQQLNSTARNSWA